MFRWSGSALLVLLPRPNRLEIVRDEIARLMDVRCEHTVQTASRTMLLPIAARWTGFPSMAEPRLLIHKVDVFCGASREKQPAGASLMCQLNRIDTSATARRPCPACASNAGWYAN
jgi:hypothetical protein